MFFGKLAEIIEKKHKDRKIIVLLDLPGGTSSEHGTPIFISFQKISCWYQSAVCSRLMIAKKNGTLWEDLDIENMIENAKSSMVFYNKFLKTEEIL